MSVSTYLDLQIKELKIVYSKDTQYGILSHVILKSNQSEIYEGVVLANQDSDGEWKLQNKAFNIIDTNLPFTHIEMSGLVKDSNYRIVSGFINTKNIENIKITFFDGLLVEIKISNSRSYDYVRLNESGGVQKIEGFSKEGKLIFKY